jgi:hypothetical protein
MFDAEESSFKICIQYPVLILFSHIKNRLFYQDPCIIDQNVNLAEFLNGFINHIFNVPGIGNIGFYE